MEDIQLTPAVLWGLRLMTDDTPPPPYDSDNDTQDWILTKDGWIPGFHQAKHYYQNHPVDLSWRNFSLMDLYGEIRKGKPGYYMIVKWYADYKRWCLEWKSSEEDDLPQILRLLERHSKPQEIIMIVL